jgi:hypothetical protein
VDSHSHGSLLIGGLLQKIPIGGGVMSREFWIVRIVTQTFDDDGEYLETNEDMQVAYTSEAASQWEDMFVGAKGYVESEIIHVTETPERVPCEK